MFLKPESKAAGLGRHTQLYAVKLLAPRIDRAEHRGRYKTSYKCHLADLPSLSAHSTPIPLQGAPLVTDVTRE